MALEGEAECSGEASTAAPATVRRWVVRELADACGALRDAEQREDEQRRRRLRAAERRTRALPRLEPLGTDAREDAPRQDTNLLLHFHTRRDCPRQSGGSAHLF